MIKIKDADYKLIEYKIKLLHMMITSMDNFKFSFFSFVIDHNITEYQTSLILNSLTIIKERLSSGDISWLKSIYDDKEELTLLLKNSKPSYKEFERFIKSVTNDDINVKYLIKSLESQGINTEVCKFLLKDCNN